MQIKPTVRYITSHWSGWALLSQQITNAGEGVEKGNPQLQCGLECKWVQPLQKTAQRFLRKLKIGNSQAVQWLGLHALTAKGTDSVPGQEAKIL